MPVRRSMVLKTASTGPSPVEASWWMVPSLFHRKTAAEGTVPEPPLQVTASSVQVAGPVCSAASARASMSAS